MKIDKEIERLRRATAVRAAHLEEKEEKPETGDFIEDAFNASAKREALNLLQSAVSAEKHANVAAWCVRVNRPQNVPCSDKI